MGTRLRRVGAVLAALAVATVSLGVSSTADAAGPKTYTASGSPRTLAVAAGQQAGITLKNTARNNIAFNAINVKVPPGLAIGATPTLVTATGAGTVTYNASTATLELRNLNVGTTASNNTATVNVTITSQVTPNCATYVWASDVRQSNNFNGTLNKFDLVGADATMTAPCNSAAVTCTAGDSTVCSTGTIYSGSGGTGQVTVEDGDTVSATLSASLDAGSYQCDEYTSTSDQLSFGITITNGAGTSGMTKTVAFSQPVPDAREAWQYQVCFKAPYDFKAQLPSQLAQDFNTGDFTGNTQPDGAEHKGLLLPCSAGYGAPCVTSRVISAGRIDITISTPVADPRVRF